MTEINKQKVRGWIAKIARKQVTIRKEDKVVLDIPMPVALLALILFNVVTIAVCCVAAIALGYSFSIGERHAVRHVVDEEPAETSSKSMQA